MKYITSCTYYEERFDTVVHVTARSNARHITAAWRHDALHITIPTNVTPERWNAALDEMAPSIRAHAPAPRFALGKVIECPDYRFTIMGLDHPTGKVQATFGPDDAKILVGSDVDITKSINAESVSRIIRRVAARVAEPKLLPRAKALAESLGVKPWRWEISAGRSVLGHCSAGGDIALSSQCLFLPLELRDYIVAHELAHLTHLDHSPAFHALLDSYLGGREKELVKALKAFRFPA